MHRITSHRFCPSDRQPSGGLVRCRMAWLLIAMVASLLVFTAPALAQTPEPPTTTPTPAASVTP